MDCATEITTATAETTTPDPVVNVSGGRLAVAAKASLRARVIGELERAGFIYDGALLALPDTDDPKEQARRLHANHRRAVLARNAKFLQKWEDRLLPAFADGADVDPRAIRPVVVPVESEEDAALFRMASLHWSVPVSQGYGRRTRFLVRDDSNGKLLGIFALGDPVFNLSVRDRLIGWTHHQRQERLYNVFDAYVLGAVEPYRDLIGGKLVALCAIADETAAFIEAKYEGTKTVIRGDEKSAAPVLVTTTSSLGRSSVYQRLKYRDRWAYKSIGFTEGFGHFHFSEDLFAEMVAYLKDRGFDASNHQYGEGPNWRIRTLRRALEELGLEGDLLRHGIRREVFIAPRALGWRAFLRGESDYLRWFQFPTEDLGAYWRDRWAIPRAARLDRFRAHRRDAMRLTPLLET